MTKLTRHQFSAVVAPAEEIEIDVDDDLPTDPVIPLAERDTQRPSGEAQAALREATKPSDAWRLEPRFSFDPVSGAMVLSEPYTAREVDRYGNVIQVGCPPGTEIRLPLNPSHVRHVRGAVVAAALRAHREAVIWPHNGARERVFRVDRQWYDEITRVFFVADEARSRG